MNPYFIQRYLRYLSARYGMGFVSPAAGGIFSRSMAFPRDGIGFFFIFFRFVYRRSKRQHRAAHSLLNIDNDKRLMQPTWYFLTFRGTRMGKERGKPLG